MWKAQAGVKVSAPTNEEDDDWETEADFENDVSEEQQRWGAKTIEGSGHQASIKLADLRQDVQKDYKNVKEKELESGPKASFGYGGKYGVQKDRMDKSAVGADYQADLSKHASQTDAAKGFGGKFGVQTDRKDKAAVGFEWEGKTDKHASQKDYSTGFGGKYGVQKDRKDKSAVGWDHQEQVAKHESQKDYSKGFGGKFGVQKENMDKAAVGWEYQEKLEKHESQTDYSKGFGGKYGVQTDRKDQSAVGWDHQEKLEQHESQTDHSKGFGGKYGVQTDRKDQSALGYEHQEKVQLHESQKDYSKGFGGKYGVQSDRKDNSAGSFDDMKGVSSSYQKTKADSSSEGAKNLKARFEKMASQQGDDAKKQAEFVKKSRQAAEERERQESEAREKIRNMPFMQPGFMMHRMPMQNRPPFNPQGLPQVKTSMSGNMPQSLANIADSVQRNTPPPGVIGPGPAGAVPQSMYNPTSYPSVSPVQQVAYGGTMQAPLRPRAPLTVPSRAPLRPIGGVQMSSYEKLLLQLKIKFPDKSRDEVIELITKLRMNNGGSLSGLKFEEILQKMNELVLAASQGNKQDINAGNAGGPPPGLSSSWAFAVSDKTRGGSNSELFKEEEEDPCVICHEEMEDNSVVRLECGHIFHDQCIRKWFQEQSTCPNCRVHTLLSDDFPSLG